MPRGVYQRKSTESTEIERLILEDCEKYKEIFCNTRSVREFAEIIGYSVRKTEYVVHKLGWSKETRIESLETKIKEFMIDSDLKFYFIGYVLGDGCIRKYSENSYMVNVVSTDIYSIKEFADRLNIRIKKVGNKYIFFYYSRSLYNELCKYGIKQNKSKEGCTIQGIPGEFEGPFLRGLMDSDGSVSRNEGKAPYIQWLGHMSYLIQVKEILEGWGLSPTIRYKDRDKELGIVQISRLNDIKRAYERMYTEGCVCLERKRQRIKEWVSTIDRKRVSRRIEVRDGDKIVVLSNVAECARYLGVTSASVSKGLCRNTVYKRNGFMLKYLD